MRIYSYCLPVDRLPPRSGGALLLTLPLVGRKRINTAHYKPFPCRLRSDSEKETTSLTTDFQNLLSHGAKPLS